MQIPPFPSRRLSSHSLPEPAGDHLHIVALLETISEGADTEPGSSVVTDEAIAMLAPRIGTRAACAASGVPQASWYRRHRASPAPPRRLPVPHRDRVQPRALAPAERAAILAALHAERFADLAPAEVWATLLDEGTYLGSLSTFYRLLREAGESRERRRAGHPPCRGQARADRHRTEPGLVAGTSPSCTARRNGPTTTST